MKTELRKQHDRYVLKLRIGMISAIILLWSILYFILINITPNKQILIIIFGLFYSAISSYALIDTFLSKPEWWNEREYGVWRK